VIRLIVRCCYWIKFQWLRVRLYRFKEISSDPYLETFLKSPDQLSNCSFRLAFFEVDCNVYSPVGNSIYHDAPLNVLLWSMDEGPIAIVGFAFDRDGSLQAHITDEKDKDIAYSQPSYVIRQIQGVRGQDELLRVIRWEKMLVQAVIDIAKSGQVSYVHVVKASKNKWRANLGKSGCERIYLRYDVTAKRMGFKDTGCKYTLAVCA